MSASLTSGQGDPEYWEVVLRRLKVHKVRRDAAGRGGEGCIR